jgi:hypothetical protein
VNGARAVIAVAAPVAVAALAMRAFEIHAPGALALQLAQPLAVLTDAGRFGALQLSILIAGLATVTVAYCIAVFKSPGLHAKTLAFTAVAVTVCVWLIPVAFSSDVYAYAVYGEAALRGLDPFARFTLDGSDPLFAVARVQWGASLPACVYGWGFIGAAASMVGISAPWGAAGQITGLRVLASLAMFACGAFTFAAVPGGRARRLQAAALIGCNPVALWCAAEGHNDALVVALGLFGCAVARHRPQLGAGIAGMAGAFKLPAVAAALPAAIRGRAWIGALAGVAVTAAATWPVLTHWTSGTNAHGNFAPHVSLQGLLFAVLAPGLRHGTATTLTLLAAIAAAGAIGWSGIADLRNGRRQGWIRLALAAWLLIPNPYPWYGLWLIAVAAVAAETREARIAVWLPVGALLRYYPDAAGLPSLPLEVLLDVLALLPYVALISVRRSGIINRPL